MREEGFKEGPAPLGGAPGEGAAYPLDAEAFAIQAGPVPAATREIGLARATHDSLTRCVRAFEEGLDADQEVGLRLIVPGQTITFYLEGVEYHDPGLVSFQGVASDGKRLRLVQHLSQLSFFLVGLPKANPDLPSRRFLAHGGKPTTGRKRR
jgi:hypothetical protein